MVIMKKLSVGFILIAALASTLSADFRGKLEAKVVDAAGVPMEKVAVAIVSQISVSIRFDVTTDASGKFTQIGIQPGYYMVTFKKEGYVPVSREVHVMIDGTATLSVKLEKSEGTMARAISESDKLFLQGNTLFQAKNYTEAAAAYEAAVAKSGIQWGYYLNLGLTYKKLNQLDKAKAAFAKAVELNAESYSANKEYGETLALEGNYEEAKKPYQKAAELSPTDPDGQYNLGAVLANSGDSEGALAAYLKCISLKPDYAEAYYQVGTIYTGQNKKAEAIANLEKFLELAPTHEKAPLTKQILDILKK
jgi:Flp pilus assembly protein TadD